MSSIVHNFIAAADPTTWAHRIVYLSANKTVALQNAGTQCPVGVVSRVETDGTTHRCSVVVQGEAWVATGETALDADAAGRLQFVRGGDDTGGAALDGRAVVCAVGDFYVGRILAEANSTAGGLVRCIVGVGQLSVAAA